MTAYAGLVLAFAGAAAVASTVLWSASSRRRPRPWAVVTTVAVLLALTAVFDNVMIASGLFHYAPEHLIGLTIGRAPVEDFAYPLAGALLLPAVWAWLRGRRGGEDPS